MTRHLLLEGRSGIGKSTLLREALRAFPGRAGGFCVRRKSLDGHTLGFFVEAYPADTAGKAPELFLEPEGNRWVSRYGVFVQEAVRALEQGESADLIPLDEFGGGGLACAGAAYQGVFQNPLVSPDVLGASSGAGFGAALALFLSTGHAAATASAFLFGIGLVMPHFARMIVGGNYRYVVPSSILLGGSFLILVDNFARLLATSEIPIGILTAFVGAPFFMLLILKEGKG